MKTLVIQKLAYDNHPRRLVYEDGRPVCVGDEVTIHDEEFRVVQARAPHKEGSTGRVYVEPADGSDGHYEYFPSVIGARWVEVKE